ncbi:class I SAM-dependent methyltransferase [Halomonas qaidamensis]|uniref:Class I SAM-dependent methyltransferase n=1 Tax=Halomonas qaidamensis TaxID=2866211 RepID=A0ABY6JMC4_9GAMM|nr:class I SAM-dependent methyltransferase [Halomonas qaidamensis]UYV18413.1 class I SAM-dependent methyltransferase [Halomonas qaidamensis]
MTKDLVSLLKQSYDSVPYESHPFPQTAPEHLHALAFLFGLDAPDPATARVLEIGCSAGENIFPYAARNPQAQVVGIDLSDVQINHGKARLNEIGLANVRLQAVNIEEIGKAEQPYDYIICHGVFSWVPTSVQQAILRVCSENLSESGIAYISYNTYPGWKTKEIIRDAMLLRGAERVTPEEKLSYAMGMVDFLQQVSLDNSVLRKVLDENADHIRQGKASYLLHEFLEPCNQPMYFKDFMALAGEYGLGYLAEAEPNTMFLSNYASSIAEPLSKEVTHQEQLEQYLDFVRNRAFRQTLLVHKSQQAKIRYALDAERLQKFYVAGVFFDHQITSDTRQPKTYTDWRGGEVIPGSALEYAFMEALSKVYPATLNVDQLTAALIASGQLSTGQDARALALAFLETYVIRGHVRIRTHVASQMATVNAEAEADPATVKWQWHSGVIRHGNGWATSPWHEMVALSPLAMVLAKLLETPVSFEQLKTATSVALEKGEISLLQDGKPSHLTKDSKGPASTHYLQAALESMLRTYQRHGVLAAINASNRANEHNV